MLVVRPAVAADAEAVARIYVDSWNEGFGHLEGRRDHLPTDAARWRETLVIAREEWWVAAQGDAVVGFVGVGPSRDPVDPDLGELDTIAVDPPDWRTGVGRALMTRALASLRATWASAILWTPAGHDRGHAFYRATGWTPLDRTRSEGRHVAFGHDLAP